MDLSGLDKVLPPERVRAVHEAVRRIEQVTHLGRQAVIDERMEEALRAAKAALNNGIASTSPSAKPYVIDLDFLSRSLQPDGVKRIARTVEDIERVGALASGSGDIEHIDRALQDASVNLGDAADLWIWWPEKDFDDGCDPAL